MTLKIGINGFGRIGRMVFRAAIANHKDIEVVAINDLLDPEYLAYMLKYDSVHGHFKGEVAVDNGTLIVNGQRIRLTAERDPAALKWAEVGADIVVDSTGLFLTKESARSTSTPAPRRSSSARRARTTRRCSSSASTTRATPARPSSPTPAAPPTAWPRWPRS